ncbi:putative membrane protein [Rhodococcus tukisamuensis]|uniref:Putative membrane protein n=1 Tax=Rhodococcus tukisamuensis TaxID=168276 RepID=A0A1G6P5P7_9NOCA|nr:YhgE/Pip domain-containing protein [Rhodococcus tukisamuensis]SDC75409.1 putative membrane protein [Rhodococcus tukisamuensis]
MEPGSTAVESGVSPRRTHLIRTALAVLVIAPLALMGFYMWALWDPGDTVSQMPVAIVNSDAGADLDGTRLDAGTEVATALLDGGDVNWQEVTLDEAKAGVEDGRYYFSVVIPEDFSKNIASAASGNGSKATLDVVYNDHNSLVAGPVGESVMAQVRSAVSESIGEQSVDQVLVGLGDVGKGLDEAAAGARQLSDGTGEALDGVTQLSDGSVELSAGLHEAYAGSGELASGTGQLAAGADEAKAGSGELAAGLSQLQDGTDQLGAGATQISEVIDTVVTPLLEAAVAAGLPTGAEDIAGQLQQLRDGARQLAHELSDPTAEYRGGIASAASGAAELNSGLGELAAGAHELDAGANELNTGLGQLDAGGTELSAGLGQLKDGVGQLDAGSNELATGLADGAKQVPHFTEAERESTAGLLSSPVAVSERNLNVAAGFGPGAVPVVMSVLLFLCGILTWFVLRPRGGRRDDEDPDEGVVRGGLRRYRAPAAITLVAALVLSVVTLTVAKADPPSVLAMVAVMILIGAAGVALGRVFTVVFGAVNGTFIALGALMIQIFAFGGVYPIEQMPAPIRLLHDLMPLTYARNALRMVLVGYDGPRFWLAIAVLAGIVVVSVAVTIWWRRRQRAAEVTPADENHGDENPDDVYIGDTDGRDGDTEVLHPVPVR